LDDIEGVGPARRKALMKRFQSLENIKNASVEELAETENMNMTVAEAIYQFFHKE
jgi:excinuclease ABC subunit C